MSIHPSAGQIGSSRFTIVHLLVKKSP